MSEIALPPLQLPLADLNFPDSYIVFTVVQIHKPQHLGPAMY